MRWRPRSSPLRRGGSRLGHRVELQRELPGRRKRGRHVRHRRSFLVAGARTVHAAATARVGPQLAGHRRRRLGWSGGRLRRTDVARLGALFAMAGDVAQRRRLVAMGTRRHRTSGGCLERRCRRAVHAGKLRRARGEGRRSRRVRVVQLALQQLHVSRFLKSANQTNTNGTV